MIAMKVRMLRHRLLMIFSFQNDSCAYYVGYFPAMTPDMK